MPARKIMIITCCLVLLLMTILANGCDSTSLSPGQIPTYQSEFHLEPSTHTLQASVSFEWSNGDYDTLYFLLHRDLEISNLTLQGEDAISNMNMVDGENASEKIRRLFEAEESYQIPEHLSLYGIAAGFSPEPHQVTLEYSGVIHDEVETASFSRWEIADETTGLIDPRGAFLMPYTGFYPVLPGKQDPSQFQTTIHIPEGWDALVEGALENSEGTARQFISEHPIDGCYLVAGPYRTRTIERNGTEVAMYFYPESEDLVDSYLEASADYVSMYNDLLGEYSFSRFSVVENWFPTGYGMPTYTLLGTRVLRLPFIIHSSLGHEICHNWWGNGVFVDYDRGNWCEGLTTFCADYYYKVQQGEEQARQYRMETVQAYSDYIVRGDEEDFPVVEFTERTTAGSRTIGYGKAMMIFYMLQQYMGEELFTESLREFYRLHTFEKVSWSELFDVFESISGEDLGWFSDQWIYRTGAPQLRVEHVAFIADGAHPLLEFDLRQIAETATYRLQIPVKVDYANGESENHILHNMGRSLYHARIPVEEKPVGLAIDPDFEVFRILEINETPPTLAGFFSEENPVILLPQGVEPELAEMYTSLAESFNRHGGARILQAEEAEADDLSGSSVLYLGRSDLLERDASEIVLDDIALQGEELAVVYAFRDESDDSLTHLAIWGESSEALSSLSRRLPHYGKYSYLAFSEGTNIRKGWWPVTSSPLRVEI